MSKVPFTKEEQEQISQAVAAAESQTSGEIVTYYVEQSDDYSETAMRGGLIFTLIGSIGLLVYHRIDEHWAYIGTFESILIVLGLLLLGIGLSFIPFIKRILAGKDLIDRRVQSRAMTAFVNEEVFDTTDRTGILLFISAFEHRVVVLGDTGINAKVKQSDWESVVSTIITGIKKNRLTEGLVDAIALCGELLHKKGVEINADDENELKDTVRIGQ